MTPSFLCLCGLLGTVWATEDPPLAEREALAVRFHGAPEQVRGGVVQAHWLVDGSSFWYRAGGVDLFLDPAEGTPRPATAADRARAMPVPLRSAWGRSLSPATGRYAYVKDGALWVGGGDLGADHPLTEDTGREMMWSLTEESWSPDGTLLCLTGGDLTPVHQLPLVDYRKAVETVEFVPYVKTGGAFPDLELTVFHVGDGTHRSLDLGTEGDCYVFLVGWREQTGEVLFLRQDRDARRMDLMAGDPDSGASRAILTERQETFVGGLDFLGEGWKSRFTRLPGTEEFLWISERDGWRHVYRHDYSGRLRNQVTSGDFPVQEVVGVDQEHGRVFVLANAEPRLYDTHLYRVDLEGGDLQRLTEGVGEHHVQLSPSKQYFVDSHSGLDRPVRSDLRDVDGGRICELERADVSALEAMGWEPPESFVVKAADGQTDLYGVLYKPAWFDPDERYPVLDVIYSGPFMTVVPNEYASFSPWARRAQALAQYGFITFLVDPRGTTERGKAFQDASFGRIGQIEIPDHVATLQQLAADRPWMDLDRVGVYGHSWGGYFALRAMLTAPEVFHVGVAGAPGEMTEAAAINEPYMGVPPANAEGYAAGLNAPLASRLRGKLLILHGTADVNAPFSTSMRMVDALIRAERPFDLLVVPGAAHSLRGVEERYVARRIRDHFLEHLRGEVVEG